MPVQIALLIFLWTLGGAYAVWGEYTWTVQLNERSNKRFDFPDLSPAEHTKIYKDSTWLFPWGLFGAMMVLMTRKVGLED